MRYILCDNASVELLDWENHVPVFAPDYVAVFDGELLEVLRLDVAVVLWVWMCKDEWLEIHSLGRAVAKDDYITLNVPPVALSIVPLQKRSLSVRQSYDYF